MIYMSASSILYDLRYVRTALQDHNTHLEQSLATVAAEGMVSGIIERIENASYLSGPDSPTEAGVGQATNVCDCNQCRGTGVGGPSPY